MTGPRIAVPLGRAGRLWLDRRLNTARRGADLLDRKLRILQAELGELRAAAARTEREWQARCAEADRAQLLAAVLSGQRGIRLAEAAGHADVRISYTVTIGVRHPAAGTCSPPPGPVPWAGPTVEQARRAHADALAAAVRHAVAAEALRIIEAESVATRYRLRAIRDRLIPRLEQARAEVALAIDEQERSDGARLRMAAGVFGPARQATATASPGQTAAGRRPRRP